MRNIEWWLVGTFQAISLLTLHKSLKNGHFEIFIWVIMYAKFQNWPTNGTFNFNNIFIIAPIMLRSVAVIAQHKASLNCHNKIVRNNWQKKLLLFFYQNIPLSAILMDRWHKILTKSGSLMYFTFDPLSRGWICQKPVWLLLITC